MGGGSDGCEELKGILVYILSILRNYSDVFFKISIFLIRFYELHCLVEGNFASS